MSDTKKPAAASAASGDTIEQELYQKRKKIYPREVHGLFATLRLLGVVVLLGLFYILPWINYDGHQAVLFDLPQRKFYIFNMVFWPQDFIYLTLLLVIAALSLFFFTALAGRLWCGFACPQTVWTELFMWIEHRIEGNRSQQIKLDKMPMNREKFIKKFSKHFIWLALSLYTGFTFVGYFTPIRELAAAIPTFDFGPWELFWIFFYGFATYGNAGWMREQVCLYMCPYARFQSAMFDQDTMIISYDPKRGEPRGTRKKGVDPREIGKGDCIDCTICVQVCPTGIDIRDGLQYQCIGCAACIDACDDVMEKMGYPKGLIRYTTENRLAGKETHVLRPRIIVYGLILLAITIGTIVAMVNKPILEMDVIRDRNSLFRETGMGMVENVYTIKIINKDIKPHEFELSAEGLPDIKLNMPRRRLYAEPGSVVEVPVSIEVDPDKLEQRTSPVHFRLQATDDPELVTVEEARFLGPVPGR